MMPGQPTHVFSPSAWIDASPVAKPPSLGSNAYPSPSSVILIGNRLDTIIVLLTFFDFICIVWLYSGLALHKRAHQLGLTAHQYSDNVVSIQKFVVIGPAWVPSLACFHPQRCFSFPRQSLG